MKLRFAGACLAALLLWTSVATGQPPARPLIVSVGQTVRLQMSTKQRIKMAANDNETAVRLSAAPGDPTTVLVTGLAPGRALITLTGEDGQKEVRRLGPK
jgi:hypothetical protein